REGDGLRRVEDRRGTESLDRRLQEQRGIESLPGFREHQAGRAAEGSRSGKAISRAEAISRAAAPVSLWNWRKSCHALSTSLSRSTISKRRPNSIPRSSASRRPRRVAAGAISRGT